MTDTAQHNTNRLPDVDFFRRAEDIGGPVLVKVRYCRMGGMLTWHLCNSIAELSALVVSLPHQASISIHDPYRCPETDHVYKADKDGNLSRGAY